jgi:RNA polymerase sigma-70 factor, ECF subfamily
LYQKEDSFVSVQTPHFESERFKRLLDCAREGDGPALGELLEVFRPYLVSVANGCLPRLLKPKLDACDAVQDAFLKAVKVFRTFRGITESELRTGKRDVHREARSRSEREEVYQNKFLATFRAPELAHDDEPENGKLEALQLFLAQLPSGERHLLRLRYDEGCSFEEIGDSVGCSGELARKACHRVMLKVKRGLSWRCADM